MIINSSQANIQHKPEDKLKLGAVSLSVHHLSFVRLLMCEKERSRLVRDMQYPPKGAGNNIPVLCKLRCCKRVQASKGDREVTW
jgi:hypothetical protein